MFKWKCLSCFGVIAVSVVGFLRVVSNEILAIEKQLRLLEVEDRARQAQAKRFEQQAA